MAPQFNLSIANLAQSYRAGTLRPEDVVSAIYDRLEIQPAPPVWINLTPRAAAIERTRTLESKPSGKLWGIPFAVKDNIDVAGTPTTAGCPAFAYIPHRSAFVVERLLDAGAILIGKTNMDQFATGLVGTRTPFGACSSVFDKRYISGGSSSGSAVAVADGLVSFSLGTDTAGSGRVPATFNNLIGLKPTRGLLSMDGVVPACRSLDCVSIFALGAFDAASVFEIASGYDPADPYSREWPPRTVIDPVRRCGMPKPDQRQFFGDREAERLYDETLANLAALNFELIEIDIQPFLEAAALLYSGPYVAERYAAVGKFVEDHPEEVNPVVAGIIRGASRYTAAEAYQAEYRLRGIQRHIAPVWQHIDVLVLPTAPTIYTIEEVNRDPVRLNANLGFYTNFVNLLDLSAVAIPAGFRTDGLPFGVTAIAPAFSEYALLEFASITQKSRTTFTGNRLVNSSDLPPYHAEAAPRDSWVRLAVVGAHLSGQPLNSQLTGRGARLLRTTRTAVDYKLFALKGTVPEKPGLIRAPGYQGSGIEVEVWALPQSEFGSFVELVPPPLSIGTCELIDGERVKGFLCESYPAETNPEITHYGSWRNYLGRVFTAGPF